MNSLAAISFSDPAMLAGLLAGAVPIALHLLNRVRSPIVPFPTLRFLKITAMKTSRRRQLQQWLLLFLRVALFALLAMAVAKPFIGGGSPAAAYGLLLLLLAGVALVVMAIGLGLDARAAAAPADTPPVASPAASTSLPSPTSSSPRHPARSLGFSALILLVGLAGIAFAGLGLGSDRYFSGKSGAYSGRNTACVVILDNSHSMLVRQDSSTRLQRAKAQFRELVADTNLAPAEVAVLVTNPQESGSVAAEHLSGDMTALLGYVDGLATTGRARPMKELLASAVKLLAGSDQTHKMIVILSDFARPAFADAAIFTPLAEARAQAGSAALKDVQVVLMPQSEDGPVNDVGIPRFALAAGQPVVGNEVTFEGQILNNGDTATVRDLRLMVDDQAAPNIEPRVQVGRGGALAEGGEGVTAGGGRAAVRIKYRLPAAGVHRFSLELKDKDDAMAWDDERSLVLNVGDQIRVLVVGADETLRPRTAAHYVMAALDPFGGTRSSPTPGGAAAWSIAPIYRSINQLANESLDRYAAVFFCDVPRIPATLADRLLAYAQSSTGGHRIIWMLGSAVSAQDYNGVLAGARALLPNELAAPQVTAAGSTVDVVDADNPVFAGLFDSQDPYRTIVVTGRWTLAGNLALRGQAMATLADGGLFIVHHTLGAAGGGDIYTVLSSPAAEWSTMATTVTFLPMINRMALGDMGKTQALSAFEPGQEVDLPVGAEHRSLAVDVTAPDGQVINVPAPGGAGEPRWGFNHTQATGLYKWQTVDKKVAGEFVVNPPAEEVDLAPQDMAMLAKESTEQAGGRETIVAPTVSELVRRLDQQAEGHPLMPGVVAMVLVVLIAEGLLANRHRPGGRVGAETVRRPAAAAA